MEEAIKKAIEGGMGGMKKETTVHLIENQDLAVFTLKDRQVIMSVAKIVIDPLFWQALGKAEGWEHSCSKGDYCDRELEWKERWHEFIDHLAEGKDIDTFFDNLLTPSKK